MPTLTSMACPKPSGTVWWASACNMEEGVQQKLTRLKKIWIYIYILYVYLLLLKRRNNRTQTGSDFYPRCDALRPSLDCCGKLETKDAARASTSSLSATPSGLCVIESVSSSFKCPLKREVT